MPQAWRIVKKKHAAMAFSGKGAADYGGRWNSRGMPVVYVSSTKSLAALEILVHLILSATSKYVAIPIQFDDTLMEVFSLKKLPGDWRIEPPSPSTQRIGDVWMREMRSVALALPSVIISGEFNYVLNPEHPDFKKISIGKPAPFAFDPRLLP